MNQSKLSGYAYFKNDLFTEWCCINKALNKVHEIKSKEHLVNITAECFRSASLTPDEQFNVVVHLFRNKTFTYTEEQCFTTDKCNDEPRATSLLYVAFWCLLFILIVVSNFLVIIANQKIPYLKQSIGSLFISSLAVSDLFVALFLIPIKISEAYHNLTFCLGAIACRFYIIADHTFFSASITNLFVITIDRYLALNHPYMYPRLLTKTRSRVIVILVWLYGCAWSSSANLKWNNIKEPSILISNGSCRVRNYIHSCTVYTLVFFIPVVVMGVLYCRIFLIAKHHAKNISCASNLASSNAIHEMNNNIEEFAVEAQEENLAALQQADSNGNYSPVSLNKLNNRYIVKTNTVITDVRAIQSMQYRKMMLKAVKVIATVFGTFVICWLPVSIISLLNPVCPDCFTGHYSLIFVDILPMLNSTMNPFIYAIMNKQYRQAFKDLLSILPFAKSKRKEEKQYQTTAMTALPKAIATFSTV